ncbi:MAG: polysaccharide deacetylase family protein [Lachnospiraceae bacterium]|nr:polysaccharide deacetylase family protein [Lachnospiraceae bacterium]
MLERLRQKWYVILAGLLIFIGGAVLVLNLILGRWVKNSDIALGVDGSVSYRAENDVEKARSGYADAGCAKIITDRKDAPKKRVAIVFDNLGEESTNEKILRIIKDHRIRATFSVGGIEAAENDEFLGSLPALGLDVAGSTLAGGGAEASDSPSELIESLVMTKNIIEGLVGKKVENVFISGTPCSRNILKTVTASGYENVIEPSNENLIDEKTFETKRDVREYVRKLSGDTIIMIKLEGLSEVIKDEIPVYPDKPAIDKKSDTSAQSSEEEEEPYAIDAIVEMLLTELETRDITICPLSDLEVTDFEKNRSAQDAAKGKKGAVIRNVITDKKEAALAIYGLPENTDEIIKTLKNENAKATFFVTGKDAKDDPEGLKLIRDSGNDIGNAGYEGESLEGKSAEECYEEISKGADALADLNGSENMCYMPMVDIKQESDLTPDDIFGSWMDGVRAAAAANGSKVIYPVKRDGYAFGDIVTVDGRDKAVDINELESIIKDLKKAGLQIKTTDALIAGSGKMPGYSVDEIRELRLKNSGKRALPIETVQTTAKAAAISLYGMSDEASIKDIFDKLSKRGAGATYYVTYDDMTKNPGLVERILLEGGNIGIAYRETGSYPQTYESVLRYINSCRNYLKWRFNAQTDLVMMPSGKPADETKEAVSSLGMTFTGYAFNFSSNSPTELNKRSAGEAAKRYENTRVGRGSIMLFRPDLYESSKMTPKPASGDFMETILRQQIDVISYYKKGSKEPEKGSGYEVMSVGDLLEAPGRYQIPENSQDVIALSNRFISGLESEDEKTAYMAQRYIGNPTVVTTGDLPGFSAAQVRKLDKKGLIDTKGEKVIFLTFDDWGTDRSINKLLYVLKKHGVKATFFVKTSAVERNVNLLRAIALDGHELASHTKEHLSLSKLPVKGSVNYRELSPLEVQNLRLDIVKSYETLNRYAGDIRVDGKDAVTPYFRPPTLTVGKSGLETVFDVGFYYSISGSFSSHDYDAKSADELIDKFRKGFVAWDKPVKVKEGSVIVMHMTENAAYTAQALDEMIPEWKEQGYGFARVDEYLSGTAGGTGDVSLSQKYVN